MKRSGFKSKGYPAAATDWDLHQLRQDAKNARMTAMMEQVRLAPKPSITYGGTLGPRAPKQPADRHQGARDLAMGEACLFMRPGCRRDPIYTVLCHTNTQADEKGLGYKGHDSQGAFGCDRCHESIDQRKLKPHEIEEVWRGVQQRMEIRLRVIAGSATERPWRVRAARWMLEQRAQRDNQEPANV